MHPAPCVVPMRHSNGSPWKSHLSPVAKAVSKVNIFWPLKRLGVQDCHISISKNIEMITFDYMTAYDHTLLYMIIYCMIIYDYIWLYMIIYDYIWLYMTIYDYIWLYVHICIATAKRLKRECPGWHRWSFPIFSRFPTCLSSWAFLCMYLSSDVDHLLSHWCQLFSYLAMRQPLLDLKKRQHASVQVVKTC